MLSTQDSDEKREFVAVAPPFRSWNLGTALGSKGVGDATAVMGNALIHSFENTVKAPSCCLGIHAIVISSGLASGWNWR